MATIFAYLTLLMIGTAAPWTNALTIDHFENLTNDGVYDDWKKLDPNYVKAGIFGIQYGNDKLYLVSRPIHTKGDEVWVSAAQGGVVSSLRTSTVTWTHKQYDRVDEDKRSDRLFTLNGRLFMLTNSNDDSKISFHKLFFFDDKSGRWLETPFDIDPTATAVSDRYVWLSVISPHQNGKTAYVVVSAHKYASVGSQMVFSKLEVEFRGDVPTKATLKTIANQNATMPSAVFFTAIKGNVLYAFVEHFLSEGYIPEAQYAYAVDLTTSRVTNVTLTGAWPPMDYHEDRMFQTKEGEMFVVGGSRMFGLGQYRFVKKIWSLNLSDLTWRDTGAVMPEGCGMSPAYDQTKGKLYLAELQEGVCVAAAS